MQTVRGDDQLISFMRLKPIIYDRNLSKIYEQSCSHLLEWGGESAQKERKKEDTANGREIKHFLKLFLFCTCGLSQQAVPCRNHQPGCFKGSLHFKLNRVLHTEAIWSHASHIHRKTWAAERLHLCQRDFPFPVVQILLGWERKITQPQG